MLRVLQFFAKATEAGEPIAGQGKNCELRCAIKAWICANGTPQQCAEACDLVKDCDCGGPVQ